MSIYFGPEENSVEPLLLGDPDGQLQGWLNRTLSLDDLRMFGLIPPAAASGHWLPQGEGSRIALPVPNWPMPPRLKLNSLYWPTGASRWAMGLFLISYPSLARLVDVGCTSGNLYLSEMGAKPLASRSLSVAMQMLPPRPLTGILSGSSEAELAKSVWLLPLVDKRYNWQHVNTTTSHAVTSETTWEQLFAGLAALLGESAESTGFSVSEIDAGYLKPDPVEFSRPCQSAAMLLDAAAWSVGQRIVVDLDGTVRSVGAVDSSNYWGYSEMDGSPLWAGGVGTATADNPTSVRVLFPMVGDGLGGESFYTVLKTLEDGSVNVEKQIRSTAAAKSASGTPSNSAELDALAELIAGHYEAWRSFSFDYAWHGLKAWQFCGAEDFAWWHFGYQYALDELAGNDGSEAGAYACFMRVCSLPRNCEVTTQLSQGQPDEGERIRFELSAALAVGSAVEAGNTASAHPLKWDGGWSVDTDVTFTVHDALGRFRGRATDDYASPHDQGSRGYCKYCKDASRWEIESLSPSAEVIRGTATATFDDGDATFTIENVEVMSPAGAIVVTQDPAADFTVRNVHGMAGATGAIVTAVRNESATTGGAWDVVAVKPQALMLLANVNQAAGVKSDDATFPVDGATLMQPPGGELDDLGTEPTEANNVLGLTLADDDFVILVWNATTGGWDAIAGGKTGQRGWGKVQAGFANDSGSAAQTVSVKACDWNGANVVGAAFNIKTPIRANKDTALFENYVVRYTVEADGTLVIDSDCFDDPIGTGRWVNVDTAVRDGWEEVEDVRDKFIKGKAAAENYEDTGGAWPAAHGDHTHAPTLTCINAPAGAGINVYGFADANQVTWQHTNNHDGTSASGPPWYAQKFIRRTS